VLILLLMVVLGMFMYNWVGDYVETQRAQLTSLEDTGDCDSVAIKVKACQNAQTLYINVTNIKEWPVHSLIFRIFDIYTEVETKSLNVTIKPEDTASMKVTKLSMTDQLELIPVIHKGSNEIVCRVKMATLETVGLC